MSLLDGPDNRSRSPPGQLQAFLQEHQQTLAATGTATVRRRRLPAEQVVWLVVGMALLRDPPIDDIVASLDLVLDPQRGPLAGGTVPQARSKLGEEPMQRLFLSGSRERAQTGIGSRAPRAIRSTGSSRVRKLIARGEAMECAASLDLFKLRKLIAAQSYDEGIRLLEAIVAMLTKMF